jgi:hypothetical protein
MRVQQTFSPVNNRWMPLQLTLNQYVKLNILGLKIPIHGLSTSLTNRYKTDPFLDKKIFRGPVIAVKPEATSLLPSQWDSLRALPLNKAQRFDYAIKDSAENILRSPGYLDSLSRVSRKIDISQLLLLGHTFKNFRKKREFTILPLLQSIRFNPMEGISLGLDTRRRWGKETSRHLDFGSRLRYGFSNNRLSYMASLKLKTKPIRYEQAMFSAGSYPVQFSRFEQISESLNTLWALDDHVSFIRLYQKGFAELDYEREIFNGFQLGTNIRYEDRFSLGNNSEFSIFSRKGKTYEPNIQIRDHQAFITEFRISWQPGNPYLLGPDRKINLRPVWPKLALTLRHAVGEIGEDAADFTNITATISDETRLGIFGNTRWQVEGGRFLRDQSVFFPDLFHQKGNEIWAGGAIRYNSFSLLPYYSRSSTADFIQFHGEHAFEGFIFNEVI